MFPVVGNEALGMPLAEAMLAGLPVVTTAAGGTTEVVADGETGVVVPRDDVAALAAATVRVLRDRRGAQAMAEKARADARRRFGWDAIGEELADQVARAAELARARRRSAS